MEIKAIEICEGNTEVDGVVKVGGWKEVIQKIVEKKLVMLENPDNVVIAKCHALGAAGIILKSDDKIQVSMIKVVLDQQNWNKLAGISVVNAKVWVDETNLKLVISK